MKRFEKFLFSLFILSIPLQLGKHFWPFFAFVNGIRVDYLSPTLYFSDALFLLLFLCSLPRLFGPLVMEVKKPFLLLAFLLLFVSAFFAKTNVLSFLGMIKFFEFFYLAFYISKTIKKGNRGKLVWLLTIGALIETGIISVQFFIQHSIGGVLYFFGERTFSVSTPAIATFQMNGSQILRGYGTFPHPNVAAFYLFVGFVFLLACPIKERFLRILKTFILGAVFIGIVLTFSRIIILLAIFSIIIETILVNRSKKGKKALVSVGLAVSLMLVGFLLLPRFLNGVVRDWLLRAQLLGIFFQIFLNHFLIGTGFNNYFFYESIFQKTVSPILLQPVHNIYLLWITQTGFFGLITLIAFLKKLFIRVKSLWRNIGKKSSITRPVFILVISCLMIGLFDHYLLTLQQGQLLISIILGFTFIREKS